MPCSFPSMRKRCTASVPSSTDAGDDSMTNGSKHNVLSRRGFIGGVGAASAVPLAAAQAALGQARKTKLIRICGSTQMGALVERWASAYRKRRPDVHFE